MGLRHILGQLRYQTQPPDEIIVIQSCTPLGEWVRIMEEFTECGFYTVLDMDDWGHDKRAFGLRLAKSDYVGFFNDDDAYDRSYIEKMMSMAEEGSEIVFCNWNTIPDCGFALGSSTSGNYIFSRSLGLEAGYRERCYEADGIFIEALRCHTDQIAKVREILYFHNEGLRS